MWMYINPQIQRLYTCIANRLIRYKYLKKRAKINVDHKPISSLFKFMPNYFLQDIKEYGAFKLFQSKFCFS